MRFLVNPAHKKRRRKRRARASASARKRRIRRRVTITRNPGGNMARKKAKRTRRRTAFGGVAQRRTRRTRRSYRRNPLGGGIGGMLMQSVKDTAGIIAGEAISGTVPRLVGLNAAGIVGTASRVAAGLLVAVVAKRAVGGRMAEMIAAGSIAGEARRFIKGANVPVLSAALGDTDEELGFLPGGVDGTVLPGEAYGGVAGYLDGYETIEGYDEAGMGDSVYDY